MNDQIHLRITKTMTLLIIVSSLFFAGCGQSQVELEELTESKATTTTEDSSVPIPTKTKSIPTPTTRQLNTIDPNLMDVDITFPKWCINMLTVNDSETDFISDHHCAPDNDPLWCKKAVINENGTVKITFPKTRHKQIMYNNESELNDFFIAMLEEEEYIKSLTPDTNYTKLIFEVERDEYLKNSNEFGPWFIITIVIEIMVYQCYAGVDHYVEVIVLDQITKEQIISIIYPEALPPHFYNDLILENNN